MKLPQDMDEDLKKAIETLRKGGIILYPTDTVWGIGCDATRGDAVRKIFELKRRSDSKAMIVLTDSADNLERYADVPEVGYELVEAAVEPLTVIYDGAAGVAPELVAADGSIAIRVTSERISSELCRRLRRPIVSTSANISGAPSPAVFSEISKEIIEGVDYVMTSRRNEDSPARPSTIIRLKADGQFSIIRK